jgi:ligand-binding SRPBCC domain-containing protein
VWDFISSPKNLKEITPRVAVKVADTMNSYPDMWKIILNQSLTENE